MLTSAELPKTGKLFLIIRIIWILWCAFIRRLVCKCNLRHHQILKCYDEATSRCPARWFPHTLRMVFHFIHKASKTIDCLKMLYGTQIVNTLEKADGSGGEGILSFHRKKPAESSYRVCVCGGGTTWLHTQIYMHTFMGFKLWVTKTIVVGTDAI